MQVMTSAHMRWLGRNSAKRHHRNRSERRIGGAASTQATNFVELSPSTQAVGIAHPVAGAKKGLGHAKAIEAQDAQQLMERELDAPKKAGAGARTAARKGSEFATKDLEEATENRSAAPLEVSIAELLAQDVKQQNLTALRLHLDNATEILKHDPESLDVNAAFLPPALLILGERNGSARDYNSTLLGTGAEMGWLAGLAHLVEWDTQRQDKGARLNIDGPDNNGDSPLLLAVRAGYPKVTSYLLAHGASTAARGRLGLTPLELAARRGSTHVTAALLGNGSDLERGLLTLRLRLAGAAEKLPRRWSLWAGEGDGMDSMRKLVPVGLQPTSAERLVVGDDPRAWVLLYKNRVMFAAANSLPHQSDSSHEVADLLGSHSFDSFAHIYSVSVIALSAVLLSFALLSYVLFRLRAYGWFDAPVALGEGIPGAFDPARLVDPDFDPSRQRDTLVHRMLEDRCSMKQLPNDGIVVGVSASVFARGLLGVYSTWLFESVRIPPEQDPYDEAYMSDDDEHCRSTVREMCVARARFVRNMELVLHATAVAAILWWLVCRTHRWGDAGLLAALYLSHALCVACVARDAETLMSSKVAIPHEKAPNDADSQQAAYNTADAACLICELFGVQHGPRWTRSQSTARSTAAPNKSRVVVRRRPRRLARKSQDKGASDDKDVDADNAKSEPEEMSPEKEKAEEVQDVVAATSVASEQKAFSDAFQRAFVQSGRLHITHGAFLLTVVGSIVICGIVLVWLIHGRHLFYASYSHFYQTNEPLDLFQVYGASGSIIRWAVLGLELTLLWLVGGRLYEIIKIVDIAYLVLRQRKLALAFARQHQRVHLSDNTLDKGDLANEATLCVEESMRCSVMVSELSSFRWSLLRGPLLVVFLLTTKLLWSALLGSVLTLAAAMVAPGRDLSWALRWVPNPAVTLGLALCLLVPLFATLREAGIANREDARRRELLRAEYNDILSKFSPSEETGEVQYVRLRCKVHEALASGDSVRWSWGREVDAMEPAILIGLVVLVCAAMATVALVQE